MPVKPFSPREFLKARRPERFSDSVLVQDAVLDRSILEYHLDTLTSRSQETDFERFARRIVEKEICPNLLPHTGPTGGGDSKVDAETYPVADRLSLVWYSGIGREAATERWAFAFSAKKKWRDKLEADLAKIAATKRGYGKAFFLTNQFVSDRTRAEVEDELRKKHGVDVRVLDRSWILDKVFANGHQPIAIDELKLATSMRKQVRKGPLDLVRQSELDALELRIKESSQHGQFGFQSVADCIEAAELARSLELPRTEVEGRFLRAKRVADEHGTEHQRLLCVYQWAWTTYWWFEDFKLFAEQYEEVETHAMGSRNAYDLELLSNLWFGLFGAVSVGNLDKTDAKLDARSRVLIQELDRLKSEPDRSSASLQAETLRLLVDLMMRLPADTEPILSNLQSVIQRCAGLVGFPLEPFGEILGELGHLLRDSPAYEKLYDTLVETTAVRVGEVTAARMLLGRGAQQLDASRPYEAIRFLGRALRRLHKHESRHDLIRALYLCASAYEGVGLLWAARGTVLTAASITTNDFWSHAEVTPEQEACYNRLRWLELRLGRLPQALAWHEVDCGVTMVLTDQGYDAKRLASKEVHFDTILGMLMLRTDLWQLKQLSRLPDVLDGLRLFLSASALRFALGYEADLPEQIIPKGTAAEDVHELCVKWRDQPAAEELPAAPVLYEGRKARLTSVLLGCKITVESENSAPCVELAESILAALESLLATGIVDHLMAREPVLTINIRKSDFAQMPFSFDMKDREGRPHLEVTCSVFDPHSVSREAQAQIKEKLFDLLVRALARVFLMDDPEKLVIKLFRDELALERAMDFTSSFVTLGNVLGHNPKTSIDAWLDPKVHDYSLKRSEEWDAADRRKMRTTGTGRVGTKLKMGGGKPPPELGQMEQVKHSQIEVITLIREALWDRAGWSGTGFFYSPDDSVPPILAPLFRDAEAAGEIFTQWRKELGKKDEEDRLRLTIIRGVNVKKPYAYRVVIGVNPIPAFHQSGIKYATMICRLNTMEPSSEINLRNFLAAYEKTGGYFLAHALLPDPSAEPELVWENCIAKRELYVRQAWEIGQNDIDAVGISEDDEPIIPAGQQVPPVLDVLRWKKRQ